MKKMILISLISLVTISACFAQFDERFYFPSKEWQSIENVDFTEMNFYVDKDTINTVLFKSKTRTKATIIYYHGTGGNLSLNTYVAKLLINEGFQVFMIDFRGYGKSTGKPTHLNIASDAQIVFDKVMGKDEFKNYPVIVYGASMGTQIATKITRDNQDKVSALILDGTISSFTDLALLSAPVEQKEIILTYVTSPYSAIEDIKHIESIPKLFIHSKEDETVPFSQAEAVYSNAQEPKDFWEYEGKHLGSIVLDKDLFVQKINSLTSKISNTLVNKNDYALNIKIDKLKNGNGQVVIQLNDTLENLIESRIGTIENNQCVVHFDSIARGKYTILYFHDENKNRELDANFMGIPKEGYGFSNNASGQYGPPPIEKRIFMVSENMSIVLEPFYW